MAQHCAGALGASSQSIQPTSDWRWAHPSHFAEEETEVQSGEVTRQVIQCASKEEGLILNLSTIIHTIWCKKQPELGRTGHGE